MWYTALLILGLTQGLWALENGLARTPPMGWMSWQRFRCVIDCDNYPEDCISERLFKEIADKMVSNGYLELGYEYLIIDDCWLAKERDENGRLQPDAKRFPSGMKALGDYIHSKGLKFGLYEDYGNLTCGGYPGSLGHLKEDADIFASWGVDYIKLDGCYADPKDMDEGYPEFGRYVLATNRSTVYSCSWPVYQQEEGMEPNFTLIAQHCNLWRNWDDIQDSWESVSSIITYFAENQDRFARFAGPGHWNDADMLIVGNYGLSYEQAKAQMAIWALLAGPLLLSHDLRVEKLEMKQILQNKDVIAVNQDSNGVQGRRVLQQGKISFWTKPLTGGEWAVAILNNGTDGAPKPVQFNLETIGLGSTQRFTFTELFGALAPVEVAAVKNVTVRIPPTGVLFFRATPPDMVSQLRTYEKRK